MLIINERIEAQKLYNGENLTKCSEYRVCLLLSKLFYEMGHNTIFDIRMELQKWAKNNNYFFTVPMNAVAGRVINEDMHFLGEESVYISESDVEIINSLFDTSRLKKIALAILCYAKAYADEDGCFTVSQAAFGEWLGYRNRGQNQLLSGELADIGFISVEKSSRIDSWYGKYVVNSLYTYKLRMELDNSGEYELVDNDIDALFAKCFCNIDANEEEWRDIPGYNDWYQLSNYKRVRVKQRVMGARVYPERILNTMLKEGRCNYVNLNENGKRKQANIDTLYNLLFGGE